MARGERSLLGGHTYVDCCMVMNMSPTRAQSRTDGIDLARLIGLPFDDDDAVRVAIVGAGPNGLSTAVTLAVLFAGRPALSRTGSRAFSRAGQFPLTTL